jgi:cytochrome c-type biogenesis protein CcmH/NrfG
MENDVAPPPESPFRRNMRLGDYQLRINNFAAALAAYREALKSDPESGPAYGGIARSLYMEYRRRQDRGMLIEAVAMARNYVAKSPASAEAHRLFASILSEAGNKEAEEHALKALELSPHNSEIHVTLGNIRWRKRKYKEALVSYEEALRIAPHNANALINCGRYWFYVKGDKAKTRELVENALRIVPGHSVGLTLMGHLLLHEGKVDEAMAHARLVVSKDPNNYDALYLIAAIETRRNPFRGLGFRAAVWYGQMRRRRSYFIIYPLFLLLLFGALESVKIPGIVACYIPALFVLYINLSVKNMKRYVRKNYLAPQDLKKDF